MTYTVQILRDSGKVETLAAGVDIERAESIQRHPSCHGARVVIVPDFAALPTG